VHFSNRTCCTGLSLYRLCEGCFLAGAPRGGGMRCGASPRASQLGSLCGKGGGHSLPRRQPRQEGVAETWVFAEMGQSKTSRASTREETSSLRKRQQARPSVTCGALQAPKQFVPRTFQRGPQGHQDRQGRKIASGLYALIVPAADADLLGDFLLGTLSSGTQPCNVLAKLQELSGGRFGGHNRPRESRRIRFPNTMQYIVSWLGPCFWRIYRENVLSLA
jgi:hypothetical protein